MSKPKVKIEPQNGEYAELAGVWKLNSAGFTITPKGTMETVVLKRLIPLTDDEGALLIDDDVVPVDPSEF